MGLWQGRHVRHLRPPWILEKRKSELKEGKTYRILIIEIKGISQLIKVALNFLNVSL
jgi:hypothetical protein